ncbi:hypothetical protein [Nonlabens sp.]|uniref:hypothetical protein n=1 Tax=Nonlabens sp. TaxID=1888209 RepID=UPI003264FD5B
MKLKTKEDEDRFKNLNSESISFVSKGKRIVALPMKAFSSGVPEASIVYSKQYKSDQIDYYQGEDDTWFNFTIVKDESKEINFLKNQISSCSF